MYYASFGVLALILHTIINHEYIWRRNVEKKTPTARRYHAFLISVMLYYVSDVLWGWFFDAAIVPLAYADTVLYFLSMVGSVLLWTRFVVSYLGEKGIFGRYFVSAGWAIFTFEILCLIVNAFIPIIFAFEANGEYVPGYVRYITLAAQVVLFLSASVYTIVCAARSKGKERIRNKTIGASGIVMSIFIVLQTMYPLLPFYAIGLLIGTSLIHIFVEEDIKLDHAIKLGEAQKKVEREQEKTIAAKQKNITFTRIAESLAANYDMIYYVDTRDNSYVGYSANEGKGHLEAKRAGDDFFKAGEGIARTMAAPGDYDRVMTFLNRDYLLTTLERKKRCSADFLITIEGRKQYIRVVVRKSISGEHFIIGLENVDEEIRHEIAQQQALKNEKELARHDELTGTKNKTAYAELEQAVQDNLDRGVDYFPFALAVCDINDLKLVNDTEGHQAGDDLIRAASALLCDTFVHSPVFRIGGDEFVIFLRGNDFAAKEELIGRLRVRVLENQVRKNGPVIAVGLATYEQGRDRHITDVFERADARMYENKQELKEQM